MAVISVSGMVSSGKSSLVGILSDLLEVPALYEDISKNVFMPLYYENRERYAFTMQVKMLSDRFKNIKNASKTRNAILDQDISADAGAFALTNYQDGGMTEHEWDLYKDMSDNMMEELPSWAGEHGKKLPDINIILVTNMERVVNNIRLRGRKSEQFDIGDETYKYFERLNNNFNNYAENYTKVNDIPSLIVDVSKIDFVNNEQDRDHVLTFIINSLYENDLLSDYEYEKVLNKIKVV